MSEKVEVIGLPPANALTPTEANAKKKKRRSALLVISGIVVIVATVTGIFVGQDSNEISEPSIQNTFFGDCADYNVNGLFVNEGVECTNCELITNACLHFSGCNHTCDGWEFTFGNKKFDVIEETCDLNDVDVPELEYEGACPPDFYQTIAQRACDVQISEQLLFQRDCLLCTSTDHTYDDCVDACENDEDCAGFFVNPTNFDECFAIKESLEDICDDFSEDSTFCRKRSVNYFCRPEKVTFEEAEDRCAVFGGVVVRTDTDFEVTRLEQVCSANRNIDQDFGCWADFGEEDECFFITKGNENLTQSDCEDTKRSFCCEFPTDAPTPKSETPTDSPETSAPTRNPTTETPTSSPVIITDGPTVSPNKTPTLSPSKNPTNAPSLSPTQNPTIKPFVVVQCGLGASNTNFDCQAACGAEGADLISITSAEQQAEAEAECAATGNTCGCIIGASDQGRGYVWSDDEPFVFQDFAPGQPDNELPSCLLLDPDNLFKWKDTSCFDVQSECVGGEQAVALCRLTTQQPTRNPTQFPTFPTLAPTRNPTVTPTESPVRSPTVSPTRNPVGSPTKAPTDSPTFSPTRNPVRNPTESPSKSPSETPTDSPSEAPTTFPTVTGITESPTESPTFSPTKNPTIVAPPTESPTQTPTFSPTKLPTFSPTSFPTNSPTRNPTTFPTESPVPKPSASPSESPTVTPTRAPTFSPTNEPTEGPSTNPTLFPSGSPTDSPTDEPTRNPTQNPTQNPTRFPSLSPTKQPSESPSGSPTESPTQFPSASPSESPTFNPTKFPSSSPTVSPTNNPTTFPSGSPTTSPTTFPSDSPTASPTTFPSESPSGSPTGSPTQFPTDSPTKSPSLSPTKFPSESPSDSPTDSPTKNPTDNPTSFPTDSPTTRTPTQSPSNTPTTRSPTTSPSLSPTKAPTDSPTKFPTDSPTKAPTDSPTKFPSAGPTQSPTKNPTGFPSQSPTKNPTGNPTKFPSESPTRNPTENPTKFPTDSPTTFPTENPTTLPTDSPSKFPTDSPTTLPTKNPTTFPTDSPSRFPTDSPTQSPSKSPTKFPSAGPTESPTEFPTRFPTHSPTDFPTKKPTRFPTKFPTDWPTRFPTKFPTRSPTKFPTKFPTKNPTQFPTGFPTSFPTKFPTDFPTVDPNVVGVCKFKNGEALWKIFNDGDTDIDFHCSYPQSGRTSYSYDSSSYPHCSYHNSYCAISNFKVEPGECDYVVAPADAIDYFVLGKDCDGKSNGNSDFDCIKFEGNSQIPDNKCKCEDHLIVGAGDSFDTYNEGKQSSYGAFFHKWSKYFGATAFIRDASSYSNNPEVCATPSGKCLDLVGKIRTETFHYTAHLNLNDPLKGLTKYIDYHCTAAFKASGTRRCGSNTFNSRDQALAAGCLEYFNTRINVDNTIQVKFFRPNDNLLTIESFVDIPALTDYKDYSVTSDVIDNDGAAYVALFSQGQIVTINHQHEPIGNFFDELKVVCCCIELFDHYIFESVLMVQGPTGSGLSVPVERSDVTSILNKPANDDFNVNFNGLDESTQVYSLGLGGSLVTKFDSGFTKKLIIFEETVLKCDLIRSTAKCSFEDNNEDATVEVSVDGINFEVVSASLQGENRWELLDPYASFPSSNSRVLSSSDSDRFLQDDDSDSDDESRNPEEVNFSPSEGSSAKDQDIDYFYSSSKYKSYVFGTARTYTTRFFLKKIRFVTIYLPENEACYKYVRIVDQSTGTSEHDDGFDLHAIKTTDVCCTDENNDAAFALQQSEANDAYFQRFAFEVQVAGENISGAAVPLFLVAGLAAIVFVISLIALTRSKTKPSAAVEVTETALEEPNPEAKLSYFEI